MSIDLAPLKLWKRSSESGRGLSSGAISDGNLRKKSLGSCIAGSQNCAIPPFRGSFIAVKLVKTKCLVIRRVDASSRELLLDDHDSFEQETGPVKLRVQLR